MTVPQEEAPANSVPAAAVIRRGLALFGITGRKSARRRTGKSEVKSQGSTLELPLKLLVLRSREVSGIPSVEVKFVDIRRNTSGEGGSLARY